MADNITNSNVVTDESAITTMARASKKLATMLASAVDDLTTLEVRTYTSEDLEQSTLLKLRAKTTIKLDGDVDIVIPQRKGEDAPPQVDENLWTIHNQIVDIAQTKRTEFIKTIAEVANILLKK